MKDLYYRLGIGPQSSGEEIAAALEAKPELLKIRTIALLWQIQLPLAFIS